MKHLLIFVMFITIIQADGLKDKISLDFRATYVDYNYDNYWNDSNAFATGVKLKYSDEVVENLEFGIAFGAIADFGLSDEGKQSMTYIFDRDADSFALLHQIYLQYNLANTKILFGRFEYSSPLIDSDDAFLLSNSFEGFVVSSDFKNVNLQLGHISKMSGTWDAGYDGGKFVSMSKSPWMHKADNQETTQWVNPVTSFGVDEKGISFIGAIYNDEAYTLQVWDYYGYEFFNSLYTQLDLSIAAFDIAFQYNTFDAVGQLKNNPNPSANIDYEVWGAKIATTLQESTFTLAYTGVSDDPSAHLWGSFGGYPYFASGMMVTYFETSLRDAHMYSFNVDTSFLSKFNSTFHVGYYDLNKNYTIDTTGTRDAINGEDYMYTYGISNTYEFSEQASMTLKLAGRTLETGNKSELINLLIRYKF
jgi:hypothetical protein